MNQQADEDPETLRISMDAKATVKIGPFSRGGASRVAVTAADHDFQPEATVTPVGLLLPASDALFLSGVTSAVTSDCLVDGLTQWWEAVRERFAQVTTLVIDLDNGPENHSRRTQFMSRLVAFARRYGLTVRLAYYPPYHSKYNPIERCWSSLEKKWNGVLLNCWEVIRACALRMTWKGMHPRVERLIGPYPTKVSVPAEEMEAYDARLERSATLPKYDITIQPKQPRGR